MLNTLSTSLLAAIILTIYFIIKKLNISVLCKYCSKKTSESYVKNYDEYIPMCRTHIVSEWKNDMLISKEKMIVVEPDFKTYPYIFPYADMDKLAEWNYKAEDLKTLYDVLKIIETKSCEVCDAAASVAFYTANQYNFPHIDKLIKPNSFFCVKNV